MIDRVVPQLVAATAPDAVTEILDGLILDVLAAEAAYGRGAVLLPDFADLPADLHGLLGDAESTPSAE